MYEDAPPNYITYTQSTRRVYPGASLMGWSTSTDDGATWTYRGKVAPPAGWAVLWGDPSIAVSPYNQSMVFMTNLAVPNSKVPASGYMDNSMVPYLGGACIARSWNSGAYFYIAQCVDDNHHFYDGSSMAITDGHAVFAAYNDVTASQIDVWRAPNETSVFVQLPNPFPGVTIASHPRIRAHGNDVFVMAQTDGGNLLMARYAGGAWSSVFAASAYPRNPVFQMDVAMLSDRYVRLGPQFAFDVASAQSPLGNDHIIVIFTRRDSTTDKLFIDSNFCNRNTLTCYESPEVNTHDTPGHQFHPAIAQVFNPTVPQYKTWKAVWGSSEGAVGLNYLRLAASSFETYSGSRTINTYYPGYYQIPCSTLGGYWGDYNDVRFLKSVGGGRTFVTPYSDSSLGCPYPWQWNANHLHVSALTF